MCAAKDDEGEEDDAAVGDNAGGVVIDDSALSLRSSLGSLILFPLDGGEIELAPGDVRMALDVAAAAAYGMGSWKGFRWRGSRSKLPNTELGLSKKLV